MACLVCYVECVEFVECCYQLRIPYTSQYFSDPVISPCGGDFGLTKLTTGTRNGIILDSLFLDGWGTVCFGGPR